MMLQVISLLTVIFASAYSQVHSPVNNQCYYTKFSPFHTFCIPTNPHCNIINAGLSNEEKILVVKLHNDYRSLVALGNTRFGRRIPRASDMLEMEWDDELAAIAQKHAEHCTLRHDCQNCRRVDRFPVGQNIYLFHALNEINKNEAIKDAMKTFFSNLDAYQLNSSHVEVFDSYEFTQAIWSKTYKVGCGSVIARNGTVTTIHLTCNYGPSGNNHGELAFKPGPPATACPINSVKSNIPGLCKMLPLNHLNLQLGVRPGLIGKPAHNAHMAPQ